MKKSLIGIVVGIEKKIYFLSGFSKQILRFGVLFIISNLNILIFIKSF